MPKFYDSGTAFYAGKFIPLGHCFQYCRDMFEKSSLALMNDRYSCRSFDGLPVSAGNLAALERFVQNLPAGPFGGRHRFDLIAAQEGDSSLLKGLGTYGFIKGFSAFVVGVMGEGEHNLEDFGFQLELIVLKICELGLGSCWLGGTFNRGRFAKVAGVNETSRKTVPAVIALGNIATTADPRNGKIRLAVGGNARKAPQELFFENDLSNPMTPETAGEAWSRTLEAVRFGPSASNKQPWRLVRSLPQGSTPRWHLYLSRTPGYGNGWVTRLAKVADIQRIDMGIALAHFQLAAVEMRLPGNWKAEIPGLELPREWEYVATWVCD